MTRCHYCSSDGTEEHVREFGCCDGNLCGNGCGRQYDPAVDCDGLCRECIAAGRADNPCLCPAWCPSHADNPYDMRV